MIRGTFFVVAVARHFPNHHKAPVHSVAMSLTLIEKHRWDSSDFGFFRVPKEGLISGRRSTRLKKGCDCRGDHSVRYNMISVISNFDWWSHLEKSSTFFKRFFFSFSSFFPILCRMFFGSFWRSEAKIPRVLSQPLGMPRCTSLIWRERSWISRSAGTGRTWHGRCRMM